MNKAGVKKIWRISLGIATEIAMAAFIILFAFGLSWLIARYYP